MIRQQWLTHFEQHIEPAVRPSAPALQRHFLIAGKAVTIHFPSLDLSELLSTAIAHREYFEKQDASLDIYVLRRSDFAGEFSSASAHRDAPQREWHFHGDSSVIEIYSPQTRRAYCLIDDDRPLRYWTVAAPFRRTFDWFFSAHGIELVHGAAVGTDECAVLISGPGGSGKSTTAMQCVAQGLSYLSDDYVALAEDGTVHGIYRTLKVLDGNPYAVENFGRELPGPGEKRVLVLDNTPLHRLPASARLKAILIPRFEPRAETRVSSCAVDAGSKELSPFALKQSEWISQAQSTALRQIMSKSACFTLELGRDVFAIPGILAQFCRAG